jgi:integrase
MSDAVSADDGVVTPEIRRDAPKKRRGGGSLFQRGAIWWIKYYRNGLPIRESSGSELERVARTLLNKRLGAVAKGEPIARGADKVRVDELLADLITEYEVNGRKSLERVKISVGHLKQSFSGARAHTVDTSYVRAYVAKRQAEQASNATINRELAALKRALTLGCQGQKILHRPYVPMLREDNARQGFFEQAQVEAVRRHLPESLKAILTFGAITGWRLSEVRQLTWAQVDFHAGIVRLEPGTTKNRLGRTFPFTPTLRALLDAQKAETEKIGRQHGRIIQWVFHRQGKPIKDFRGAWQAACEAAGVPGRLFHDLRRTAVRNLERAGVPRSVAMLMTGHKTESVYRRYAIVSEADLHHAAKQLHAATGSTTGTATGTISGTVTGIQGSPAAVERGKLL